MNSATPRAITREALNELPVVRYEGPIHFVDTPALLHAARQDILGDAVVGFDTETRPAFRKGESYLPSLAQVATANAVHILPLRYPDTRGLLAEMLAADIVKAGVSLAHDLRMLRQVFPFEDRQVIDLGVIAKRQGYGQTGVRNLAGLLLGCRVPKGAKTTNWAAPQLTPAQIAYAATDAWVCRELCLKFGAHGLVSGLQSVPGTDTIRT
ncbi:MAG: 3'-5' exonuclease [Burkholderiales bacterium]|jgi:ribonuclease D|nr:3'-5' exonuclease [Burkholderiales bacterium]MDP2396784.1 3'-5' exonuclease [Burkholderiales bacterium]